MRKNKSVLLLIFVLPLFLVTSCVSKKITPVAEIQYYKPPALSNAILDKRVDEIKKMLEEDTLSEDRKETAVSILQAYDKLKSLNKENSTEKEFRKTIKLLFETLVSIEQQYFYSGIVPSDNAGEIIFENYSEQKNKIYEDYYAENYSGVITGCYDLISGFGKNGLTTDLGIILVEALAKNNMSSDALTVAKSILAPVEIRPDLIQLLATSIELEIKMGNRENASLLYEKLVDNINERNNLYQKTKNLLSKSSEDSSIVDESITKKMSTIDPEKSIQITQLVNKVEDLISKKDFSGARLELYRRKLRAEEGAERDMIEQLLKSLDKAEEQNDNKNNNNNLIIDDARKLVEEEKYEEALDILEPAFEEGDNYEAEKVKKEAVEKLINRDMNIAGKLRIAALNEGDKQKKRDLLLKARSILQNLIDKYPASPSIGRVKRNISIVDEELMQLPPVTED